MLKLLHIEQPLELDNLSSGTLLKDLLLQVMLEHNVLFKDADDTYKEFSPLFSSLPTLAVAIFFLLCSLKRGDFRSVLA
jgi:hypothetical protein